MTAAVLTTAPSSGSGSDNCRCPIELSSRLTGCECLILLGLGENVTYVWRWGLVQGTRHSHILRHQAWGAGISLRLSNRPTFTPPRVATAPFSRCNLLLGRQGGSALGWRLVGGGGRCSVTCAHVPPNAT